MLKNISRLLIIAGAVITVIAGVSLLVLGIVLLICGNLPAFQNFVIDGIENGTFVTDLTGTSLEVAIQVQRSLSVLAIIFLVISIFCIASSISSFLAQNSYNNKIHIINLVLSFCCENILSIAGSVILLIENKNEKMD